MKPIRAKIQIMRGTSQKQIAHRPANQSQLESVRVKKLPQLDDNGVNVLSVNIFKRN